MRKEFKSKVLQQENYLFDMGKPNPKEIEEIRLLFEETDWRIPFINGLVERKHGRWKTENLIKASSLPYLVNVDPSERGLAKVLNEFDELRAVCGLERPPGERVFYDFRRKYKEVYPDILLNALISFVLSGLHPKTNLPFVEFIQEEERLLSGYIFNISWDAYRSDIKVFTCIEPKACQDTSLQMHDGHQDRQEFSFKRELRNAADWAEYRRLVDKIYSRKMNSNKKGLSYIYKTLNQKTPKYLEFPFEVKATLNNGKEINFRLNKPTWKTHLASTQQVISDTYSYACSVLVLRERNGQQEVLLSARRDIGYGEGKFALPGGKKRQNESLMDCASREMEEETGLKIVNSRPISRFTREIPDRLDVEEIGVLVLEGDYVGEPETKEITKHVGWKWHNLESLPEPLFDPTRTVINHYKNNSFPNLEWDDFEPKLQNLKQLNYLDSTTGQVLDLL